MTGELQDNDRVLYDWPPRNDANPSNVPPWKFVLNSNQRFLTPRRSQNVVQRWFLISLSCSTLMLFSLWFEPSLGGSHAGHQRKACRNKRALQLDKHWTRTCLLESSKSDLEHRASSQRYRARSAVPCRGSWTDHRDISCGLRCFNALVRR